MTSLKKYGKVIKRGVIMFIKYELDEDKRQVQTFSYTELDVEPSFLHSHSLTEIILPLNDNVQLVTSKQTVSMRKENVYIITPHVMHTEIKAKKTLSASYYTVKIDHVIVKDNEHSPCLEVDLAYSRKELVFYLDLAKKNFENNNKPLAMLNLQCFFLAISELLKKEKYTLSQGKQAYASGIISEIKHYISNNYGTEITITDICKRFDISHSSLLERFHKEMGISPKEYLTQQRLNAATYLLLSTDFPISQITTLCGFDSAPYFTKIFKHRFGVTPKNYRLKPQ